MVPLPSKPDGGYQRMFRIYEWTFSSTAELATGALLVLTIFAVAFAAV